jgi:phosphohistidine swiveling domain-containing protein
VDVPVRVLTADELAAIRDGETVTVEASG